MYVAEPNEGTLFALQMTSYSCRAFVSIAILSIVVMVVGRIIVKKLFQKH